MAYHIAVDSCTDLTAVLKADRNITSVPLTLIVGEEVITDDETFDQEIFLRKMASSRLAASSACPSPESFMEAFGYDPYDTYVVTLSAELSGSYNSARLGADLLSEQYPEKNIHIFNSRSASCGQTLIVMKIRECLEKGKTFEDTVTEVERYISELKTMFVLESLETLHKSGRLKGLKAGFVSAFNIKPVMGSTPDGNIQQLDMARGIKKALAKMADLIGRDLMHPTEKYLAIAHCNCRERAEWLKLEIEKRYAFKEIIIVDTGGVSSMYADDGGIIIAF